MSWVEGIQAMHEQAGGLLELTVVQPGDMAALLMDAMAGDADAGVTLRQVRSMLDNVARAPRKKPALCGSCPLAIRRRSVFSVVIAWPRCDSPSQALALAICPTCGSDFATVKAKAAVALRRIWPDLRPIDVTHPGGGHA